ncbi:hypothetical protein [Flavobacterium reichenbachii]|uniref:Uncharacterized protein n=1 Tax=Flavobacterium reichenbachii TaxID=362418 RepID=A0A085ZI04_9FLAO|nr:hypothetical protein [Flavobacterium reichenbachii]KFF04068.1 hypothetical protein IW19_00320 [Flavobacterium reichenbachii]OXB12880.1 hypothetical protein B0A68_17090 [Flavobacterium reichenbachii]
MKNEQEQKEEEIQRNLEKLDYPANEDIYSQEEKLKNINPENINTEKSIDQKEGEWNENSFNTEKDDQTGEDLDVPGSELDDQQENIGSEDEENNYYSESDN